MKNCTSKNFMAVETVITLVAAFSMILVSLSNRERNPHWILSYIAIYSIILMIFYKSFKVNRRFFYYSYIKKYRKKELFNGEHYDFYTAISKSIRGYRIVLFFVIFILSFLMYGTMYGSKGQPQLERYHKIGISTISFALLFIPIAIREIIAFNELRLRYRKLRSIQR